MTETAHVYLLLQNSTLDADAWARLTALVDALPTEGDRAFDWLHQAPVSLDGTQIVYEATFITAAIEFSTWRQRLADAANVTQAAVSVGTFWFALVGVGSTLLSFVIAGTEAASLQLFGVEDEGVWPTAEASAAACRQFIADHPADWPTEPPEPPVLGSEPE